MTATEVLVVLCVIGATMFLVERLSRRLRHPREWWFLGGSGIGVFVTWFALEGPGVATWPQRIVLVAMIVAGSVGMRVLVALVVDRYRGSEAENRMDPAG